MARPQPLPHIDWPQIEPRPLSQEHNWAQMLGHFRTFDEVTSFLAYAIAILHACRPRVDDKRDPIRKKVNPLWAEFVPRVMAAEHARTIKELRRTQRTGLDDWLRLKLRDASRTDYASSVCAGMLASGPFIMPSIETIEASRQACLTWPRVNPRWEAVRLAVLMSAVFFWWLATPAARCDKARQQSFILAMLDAADFGIEGLRRNPGRLDHDAITGPCLALLRLG